MNLVGWIFTQHVTTIVVDALVLLFVAQVIRQRQPTGSAFAWLLSIILVPYAGIPLYLAFGGRKFKRRASEKERLRLGGHAPDDAKRALGLESTLDAVEWLDDGVLAYDTFLREIRNATRSIRIVTFVIGDDATGNGIIDALVERATAGVEVRLLLDDLLRFHAPARNLARLKAAGGRLGRFMPLVHLPFRGQDNLRNHRKIALFDGERAVVGGMNLATEYMGPAPEATRWRDLSTLVSGAAVGALDAIFRADWEFATRERLGALDPRQSAGDTPVTVVPSGPDAASDPIYDTLLTAVFRASRRVWISTPYFVPDDPLMRALAIAVRRGVDVRVVVPVKSNHALANLIGEPNLRDLSRQGATVRVFPKMLHAKAVLVDDALAVVGSANFDMRSLFLNYEIALLFSSAAEVSRLAEWFRATFALAAEGPVRVSSARSALGEVARLVAPLV